MAGVFEVIFGGNAILIKIVYASAVPRRLDPFVLPHRGNGWAFFEDGSSNRFGLSFTNEGKRFNLFRQFGAKRRQVKTNGTFVISHILFLFEFDIALSFDIAEGFCRDVAMRTTFS